MKKINRIVLTGFISTFLFFTSGFSQDYSDWSVGIRGGVSTFYGDLANYGINPIHNFPLHNFISEKRKFMMGIFVDKPVNPFFSLQGRFHYGKLQGKNDDFQQYFEATIWDINLSASADLTNIIWGENRMRKVSFYALAGIGLAYWRSTSYNILTNDITGQNSSKGVEFTTECEIPFGLGVNYNFIPNFYLNFETTIHGINTDKLDSYISGYRKVEGFGYTSIGIGYRFASGRYLNLKGRGKFAAQSDKTIYTYWKKREKRRKQGSPVIKRKKQENPTIKTKKYKRQRVKNL